MVKEVEVSDLEVYELGLELRMIMDVPVGISRYYPTIALSSDERYIVFCIRGGYKNKILQLDKVAIWDTRKKEIINLFPVCNFVRQIMFMPTKNYIVVRCLNNYPPGEDIRIINVKGELIKQIDVSALARRKLPFYKVIYGLTVSPDSHMLAIRVPYVLLIYDIESDEIVRIISKRKLRCIEGGQYLWVKEERLVITTWPLKSKNCFYALYDRGWYAEPATKYATLMNPYTYEIYSRIPVRYSRRVGPYRDVGPCDVSSDYNGNAYFVSPDGEYVIIVNRYIDIAKFSDFDANGRYLGSGKRWKTVKEFKTRVSHVGWSLNSKELIYQYRGDFVVLNYDTNIVTMVLKTGLKNIKTSRLFWLRGNVIYFLSDHRPYVIGVFKF